MLPPLIGRPLAEQIPDRKTIQTALERAEEEAAILRKLLRLAFVRDETAERLARQESPAGGQGNGR